MFRYDLQSATQLPRSVIANYQRCWNIFPEINPADSPTPLTFYQRAGRKKLLTAPVEGTWRGIFQASNGDGYGVVGQAVYFFSWSGTGLELVPIGILESPNNTPVSFVDDGIVGMLTDNSGVGYWIDLASHSVTKIVDDTGTFVGSPRVDYLDSFIVFSMPGTNTWGSTLSNPAGNGVENFDPLYVAKKNSWPDAIQGLVVNKRYIHILGRLKSEIWLNSGAPDFPFQEMPGTQLEHGVIAKYSISHYDQSVYFLSQSLEGFGIVARINNFQVERISDHSLEWQIKQMVKNGYPLDDAIGYCFQSGGHAFYVLTFPSADQTWVYDESTKMWHQEGWTDGNGQDHRLRGNCFGLVNGRYLEGDFENGNLYEILDDYFWDDVGESPSPLVCAKGFPHLKAAMDKKTGQLTLLNGMTGQINKIIFDVSGGEAQAGTINPTILVRVSLDRGKTFGDWVTQSAGDPGEYLAFPQLASLGQSRDAIIEIQWSFPGNTALNGAWIDVTPLTNLPGHGTDFPLRVLYCRPADCLLQPCPDGGVCSILPLALAAHGWS
jgi:hypothetical protein